MSIAHTPAQAAQIAGVSRSTISRACKSGKLQAIKGNQGWRIDDEDLRAWMGDQVPVQRTGAAHVHDHQDMNTVAQLAELKTENRILQEQVSKLTAKNDQWEEDYKKLASRRWWDFLKEWRSIDDG